LNTKLKKILSFIPLSYYPLIAILAFLVFIYSSDDHTKQADPNCPKNIANVNARQYTTKSLDFGAHNKAKQVTYQWSPKILYNDPYVVKKGDCLWDIARRSGTTTKNLRLINDIGQNDRIYVGQIIYTTQDITQNYYQENKKVPDPQQNQPVNQSPFVAENGSYYGQPNENGIPKTVYVRGYYRKDGTYVRSHYRSPPGSNPPSTSSSTFDRYKSLESTNSNITNPRVAENGSYYGEPSKLTGRPKTVYVRGYYRKDGTYVRGHYRSKGR